ncbi:MAG: hypothetical protein AB8G17_11355 [Gammaproteobacteria bacterium]
MSRSIQFHPLLQIGIEHAYFGDEAARGLRLVPSETTSQAFARYGCRFVSQQGAGMVWISDQHEEPTVLTDTLSFMLELTDPIFLNFTNPDWQGETDFSGCLYFCSDQAHAAAESAARGFRLDSTDGVFLPVRARAFRHQGGASTADLG